MRLRVGSLAAPTTFALAARTPIALAACTPLAVAVPSPAALPAFALAPPLVLHTSAAHPDAWAWEWDGWGDGDVLAGVDAPALALHALQQHKSLTEDVDVGDDESVMLEMGNYCTYGNAAGKNGSCPSREDAAHMAAWRRLCAGLESVGMVSGAWSRPGTAFALTLLWRNAVPSARLSSISLLSPLHFEWFCRWRHGPNSLYIFIDLFDLHLYLHSSPSFPRTKGLSSLACICARFAGNWANKREREAAWSARETRRKVSGSCTQSRPKEIKKKEKNSTPSPKYSAPSSAYTPPRAAHPPVRPPFVPPSAHHLLLLVPLVALVLLAGVADVAAVLFGAAGTRAGWMRRGIIGFSG
ncbi:hypothetical protein B0H14DRAFT_3455669 [Mycena olivaceomarginata]|nr:hypothetical protein B0H14DRAFT_3455669 [Mycena olivaceomarginata]